MSYLVLARKFRPQSFADVTGQEHVTRTLSNAIKRNKVAHAYLLSGPRGVGKTSIARIFSKCLNCESGPTSTPCLKCNNCTSIANGTSLAVREIDGASHNSVDNVRELIENFRALPAPGSRYKIYIIDEVHMLSISAFNALLKSLEEPPPNTVFILATTESHKIPETVISRCQRHDLRALTGEQVEECLGEIVTAEKMEIEPSVLRTIARLSEGSMRDAQSLLDRVQSFCDGKITSDEAGKVLGVVDRAVMFRISAGVFARKPADVLSELQQAFSFGIDPALFLKEFVAHWREILIGKAGGDAGLKQIGVPADDRKEVMNQVASVDVADIQDLSHLASSGADTALRSSYPKYGLEALLVRMATREKVRDLNALLDDLKTRGGGSSGGGLPQRQPVQIKEPARQQLQSAPVASIERSAIDRVVIEKPVAAAIKTSSNETASAVTESSGRDISWEEFVALASLEAGAVLTEQLRRLSVVEFQSGVLKGRGTEFCINYLTHKGNKEKVEALLEKHSKRKGWKVVLEASAEPGAASGSLHHAQQAASNQSREERAKSVTNHPKIKSLQKVFPGSTIEAIHIKE